MTARPNLLFLSLWDASNRNAESGYAFSMRKQLQKQFAVNDFFPLEIPGERFLYPLRAAYKAMGQYYHPMREPVLLKSLARKIESQIRDSKPDVIFAPSSIPLTYVDANCPTVYATDQLFCDFVDTYIATAAGRFRQLGNMQEKRAMDRVTRATFPSEWAATSARQRYGAPDSKVAVIPWGANLPKPIPEEIVQAAIASRPFNRCELVFVGRDWTRKGGDALVATVEELNKAGLPTKATIIGCDPPDIDRKRFDVYPFINKGKPSHFAQFTSIMLRSHFLFLPSRAEAYGQAFCEAAAFGVPSIGSTVGGIPTIIRENETGFLRPTTTPPSEYSALIRTVLADPARYIRLAQQAREDYLQRLNWDKFGERLNDTLIASI